MMPFRSKKAVMTAVFLLTVTLLSCVFAPGAEARRGRDLPRHIVLTGSIGLEYERKWVTGDEIEPDQETEGSAWTQTYRLEVNGPLVDPRLIIFDIKGDFMKRSGSGSDLGRASLASYTARGVDLMVVCSISRGRLSIRNTPSSTICLSR